MAFRFFKRTAPEVQSTPVTSQPPTFPRNILLPALCTMIGTDNDVWWLGIVEPKVEQFRNPHARDSWWASNFHQFDKILLDTAVSQLSQELIAFKDDPYMIQIKQEQRSLSAKEKHKRRSPGGVDLPTLQKIVNGELSDKRRMVSAEGQLMRLLLSCPYHEPQMIFLKLWIVVTNQIAGAECLRRIMPLLNQLQNISQINASCDGKQDAFDVLKLRFIRVHQLIELWWQVIETVRSIRVSSYGRACFSVDFCKVHLMDCTADLSEQMVKVGNGQIASVNLLLE